MTTNDAQRTTRAEAERIRDVESNRFTGHRDAIAQLAADYLAALDEVDRLRAAMDGIIADAGAIWDDDHPVHGAHGTRLDMMLLAAKSALLRSALYTEQE